MAVVGDGGAHGEEGEKQDHTRQHTAAAQKQDGVQALFPVEPGGESAGAVDALLPAAQYPLPQMTGHCRQQAPHHQQKLKRGAVALREPVGLGLPDHPAPAAAEPAALLSGPEPEPAQKSSGSTGTRRFRRDGARRLPGAAWSGHSGVVDFFSVF